jgi:DNA-binding HxlR family transcriptional regulator
MKGVGKHQLILNLESRRKILAALSGGGWIRYRDIVKSARVGTTTASKFLKNMVAAGEVEKKVDFVSGEYPYPVLYKITPKGMESLKAILRQEAAARARTCTRTRPQLQTHDSAPAPLGLKALDIAADPPAEGQAADAVWEGALSLLRRALENDGYRAQVAKSGKVILVITAEVREVPPEPTGPEVGALDSTSTSTPNTNPQPTTTTTTNRTIAGDSCQN